MCSCGCFCFFYFFSLFFKFSGNILVGFFGTVFSFCVDFGCCLCVCDGLLWFWVFFMTCICLFGLLEFSDFGSPHCLKCLPVIECICRLLPLTFS